MENNKMLDIVNAPQDSLEWDTFATPTTEYGDISTVYLGNVALAVFVSTDTDTTYYRPLENGIEELDATTARAISSEIMLDNFTEHDG